MIFQEKAILYSHFPPILQENTADINVYGNTFLVIWYKDSYLQIS